MMPELDTEFVPFATAAGRIGVSKELLRRRVRQGELTVFTTPLDRRCRLIRVDDLESLRRPQPLPQPPTDPDDAVA